MSRATAAVRFGDGTVRWCVYDGTTDSLWPRLFDTSREAWDAYMAGEVMHIATEGDVEPVEIAEDYGGGAHWPGRSARNAVVGPLYPCDDDVWEAVVDGRPAWFVQALNPPNP